MSCPSVTRDKDSHFTDFNSHFTDFGQVKTDPNCLFLLTLDSQQLFY